MLLFMTHSEDAFKSQTVPCCPLQLIVDPISSVSVAGLGVRGPFGPRTGISSGILPGKFFGPGGAPGSRTGGGISGFGLPGGIPGGGSVGVPGVAGGISGGSIGIYNEACDCRLAGIGHASLLCFGSDNEANAVGSFPEPDHPGAWQTASMLWPSGSSTKAP